MAKNFYADEPIESVIDSDYSGADTSKKVVNGVLVASPPQLEAQFKSIRTSLYSVYSGTIDYVNHGYKRYYNAERQVTDTVSELHSKNEDLLPNAAYVVIGGLTGTVFARQRSILAKITFPIVLGVASFKYFLPQTFSRTSSFIWKLEKTNLPELANQQEVLVKKSEGLVSSLGKTSEESTKKVGDWIDNLRYGIKKYTGLNVDEDATKK